jgi:hypothetical protein
MAKRIQRQRTKGWRLPADAVYVGRPTKWGNPWQKEPGALSAQGAVDAYVRSIQQSDAGGRFHHGCPTSVAIREHLAGKDLACWCPLDQPCHADVLLRIANEDGQPA